MPSRLELVELGNSARLAAGENLTGLRLRVVSEGGLPLDYDPHDKVLLHWGDKDHAATYNEVSRLFCFDNLPVVTQEGYKTAQIHFTHQESGKKLSHKFSVLVTPGSSHKRLRLTHLGKPSLITTPPWDQAKFSTGQPLFENWNVYITDQFGNICKDICAVLELSIKPSKSSESKSSIMPTLTGQLTAEASQGQAKFSKVTFAKTTAAPSAYYTLYFDQKKHGKLKAVKNSSELQLKPCAIEFYFTNEEEDAKKKQKEQDEDIDDFQSETEQPQPDQQIDEIKSSDADEQPDEEDTICSTYSTQDPQLLEKATMLQNITPLSMMEPNLCTLNSMDLDMSYSAFKEDKASFELSSIRSQLGNQNDEEETIKSSVEPSKSPPASLITSSKKPQEEETITSSLDISRSLIASLKTPAPQHSEQDEELGTIVPDTFPSNSYPSQSITHPNPLKIHPPESDKESELVISSQISTSTQKKKRIFLSNYESDSDESSVIVSSGVSDVLNFDEREIDKIDTTFTAGLFPRKNPAPQSTSPKFAEPHSPAKNSTSTHDKTTQNPLQTEQLKSFAVSFVNKKPVKNKQTSPPTSGPAPKKKTKPQPQPKTLPAPAPAALSASPNKPAKLFQKPETPKQLPKHKSGKQETSSSTQTPPAKKQKVVDPFYDRPKSAQRNSQQELKNRIEDVDEFVEDKPKRMKFVLKNSYSQF